MRLLLLGLCTLLLAACAPNLSPTVALVTPTVSAATPSAATPVVAPEWFSIKMTDARTNQLFSISDFQGKVVLVETMAVWCPNCQMQEEQVKKMHELLGNPPDLISVSLDVDLNEDQAMLAEHVAQAGFDWRFAVAPLAVDHALGNLYNAEYLNPPLAPMLIIDRQGRVFGLPYRIKSAEALQRTLAPYLAE